MLNTKKLLTKMLGFLNLRVVSTTTPSTTIANGNYTSVYATAPSGNIICVVGYLITGTGNTAINIYGVRVDDGKPQFYIRNMSGGSATITITAYSLVRG